MAYWWKDRSDERYWCEITDRTNLGANLWCPQSDESGKPYWSYSLISEVAQGDIVFHYWTPQRAFVGASIACGVLEDYEIVWTPHGTVGRSKVERRTARPGWRLPLTGLRRAKEPLRLSALNAPGERKWLEDWVARMSRLSTSTMIPIQLYPRKLRANQGYLTKMPREFVERWSPLRRLADELATLQDDLTLDDGQRIADARPALFRPKSSEPYSVIIKASQRVQSRNHEKLVETLGKVLIPKGAQLQTNRHPIDVFMNRPDTIIIEAKAVGSRHPGHAVREAVGQLLEYRHFIGPREAKLCVALDAVPPGEVVSYVEDTLGMFILWTVEGTIRGGPQSAAALGSVGVTSA